jgi:cyclopropane-fatty-acyl-phospholipid synthase
MNKEKTATLTLPANDARGTATPPLALDRWLARQLLSLTGNPALALVLWDGSIVGPTDDSNVPRIVFRDRAALYRLLVYPDLEFGDLYSVGRIDVEGSLLEMLENAYRGIQRPSRWQPLKRLQAHLFNRPRANTLADSRYNIHHHYDLGNDFYELWLDSAAMQYTCAYFPTPTLTLEEAQQAKLDHVCRKLQLKPGDRVIEAGCGWGGLALHMARHYGVTVRAYNISREQVAFARARARREGLAARVEYVEDDYRNVVGACDAFVSVGMLEHVGREQYRELGTVIRRVLTDDGRALLHSIGRNQPDKMNAWVEKRIFPGAYPPTLAEMMEIVEPNRLSVLDVENIRLHYARTLEHWLERFERHAARIEQMFDAQFVRAWRLYLAGSIAAFTTGSLQLFQLVLTPAENNNLAWSRAHLYNGGRAGELHRSDWSAEQRSKTTESA